MSEKQQNIGKSTLNGTPNKPFRFILGDGVVKARNLAEGSLTADKLAEGSITTDKIADGAITSDKLSSEIIDYIISTAFSVAAKDIKIIWNKISEITGEQINSLFFKVSPEYFISEEGANVHIKASSEDSNAVFEHIAFYINGLLVSEAFGVDTLEYDGVITETSEIGYKATVLGEEYTETTTVAHYSSYWIGAGNLYTDVMDNEHLIPVKEGMRSQHDISFHEADKLFIIIGSQLRDQFIRADMNGFEISFNETVITVEGNEFSVLESDPFHEGMYNIDING